MPTYKEVYPPVETILEMEPEELAPFVLKHLSGSGSQQLNMHNFSVGTDPSLVEWAGSFREEVLERFVVAWRWLERELFIAPKPGEVNWSFITPRGHKILESQDFEAYQKGCLLPSEALDPVLIKNVKPLFIRGDYDTAVFQAFKELEIRVREKAGLSNNTLGTDLMRNAFSKDKGVLTDQGASKGERIARMELFAGAIGAFKNPNSHRRVALSDPKEASDIIHLANQLFRIVESIDV
jgi:uncharacterized protein (TIGR02391 family)